MFLDRIRAAGPDVALIARDGFAAAQWEACLVESSGAAATDNAVSVSSPLQSRAGWLEALWESRRSAGSDAHSQCLLTPGQTDALWRAVIRAAPDSADLIAADGIAGWTRSARRSLFDHGIDPASQSSRTWPGESSLWLDWNRSLQAQLDENGWIDQDSLLYRLNRLALPAAWPGLIELDPPDPAPEWSRLLQRWREHGGNHETLYPAVPDSDTRAVLALDPADELARAASWAEARLDRPDPTRIAVVIPDLDNRRDEAERAFAARIGSDRLSSVSRRSLAEVGMTGAALAAITLLAPDSDFAAASRWLRSPFFPAETAEGDDVRHIAELRLREDPRAGQPFVDAYFRYGLRSVLQQRVPATAARFENAMSRLPRRATPTGWAQAFQSALDALGWRGFSGELPEALRSAWDDLFRQFSMLTPVLGLLDQAEATRELNRLGHATTAPQPLKLGGVHLLQHMSQIGPGYSGAWITAFSDSNWPEPRAVNPLIPWSVQAASGMAEAAPEQVLAQARREFERLRERVPLAVFSCPLRIADQPQVPSAQLRDWQPPAAGPGATAGAPAERPARTDWETVPDPAPPFESSRIPGGAATLNLQARSPAEAFCRRRLYAEPLAAPSVGIAPLLRGLLIHRALELLVAADESDDGARAQAAVERAFEEFVPAGDAGWSRLVASEKARTLALIDGFRSVEGERKPFTTLAVEQRIDIEIGGHVLAGRIDRIDRLESGKRLLIDYKTGRSSASGWFDDRLSDCQLPLYAQHEPDAIDGIAVVTLAADQTGYRAAGVGVDALPGRQRNFDPAGWQVQLDTWRDQLETLVAEFVRGDVRVGSPSATRTQDRFAVLTRWRDFET